MRIIDAHAHLVDEPNYLDNLLRAMDRCGIEKCCLSGLGSLFGCADDNAVRKAFGAHPDRIIGAIFLRPGVDGPEKIDHARQDGFALVKTTIPKCPYDDSSYGPLWQQAADCRMPVLFHTGIVTLPREAPYEGISSWNMHPMRIEPISRAFPDLGIIIAHLGVHWNHDAADLTRLRPNIYVDLTGEPEGWRRRADTVGMDSFLWWPGAFEKVLFGTDVHYSNIERILNEDFARLDKFSIDKETRTLIFSGNIVNLLDETIL